MRFDVGHRRHAARVAAIATVIVAAGYLVAVFVLNLLVVHRLTAHADVRLSEQLVDARKAVQGTLGIRAPSVHHDQDVDDAPAFVWSVSAAGEATPLTSGAPGLPSHAWTVGATTMQAGGTSFRFQAEQSGSGWLVAGESIGQIKRVQSALILPEVLVGSAAVVIVFVGAMVIGLRASAPLELVRRRQAKFTADASHELRTPLSVIEAEVDLALSRPRDVSGYQVVLERVAGEGHRLRSIVDDLLWLARADDEGARELVGPYADVAAIAKACVDRFQAVAQSRDVTLRFVREGTEPALLHAEWSWIDRLVGVLVDNAIRYAGPGGRAEIRVRTEGHRVLLEVGDSGPGILIEDRDAVFDRFHRGSQEPGGAGLGLAIADSVVHGTEGTWSIKTSPLGGAGMEVSWGRQARSPRRRVHVPSGPSGMVTDPESLAPVTQGDHRAGA